MDSPIHPCSLRFMLAAVTTADYIYFQLLIKFVFVSYAQKVLMRTINPTGINTIDLSLFE